MKTIMLHCCCAPCSSAILEWMMNNDVMPVLYYCNPNIYPEEEYMIRKNEITRYAEKLGITIYDDDYDHEAWLRRVAGMENEPERGKRCMECFKMRLLRTAEKCRELGIGTFTTTLASSRWKSIEQINEAGRWAAEQVDGVTFDERNWRKGGLQQRRNELLKENGFYNQLYCGCEFSFRKQAMDNKNEIFPVVNEQGEVTGKITRGEAHDGSKVLHPVVHLHVFNTNGDLYLQHRPAWKDIQPDKWDTATGGHVDYGETIEEALFREVREELGITDFVPEFICRYVFEGKREKELVYVHKTTYDGEVTPSQTELAGGRFWSREEIAANIGKGVFTPNFEDEYQRIFGTAEAE